MSRTVYYPRALEDPIIDASEQFPVLLLTGPRQVGKTTLLQHLCGDERRYVSLDDLTRRALARDDPALFLQRFPPPVLIDEIQYAPGLLPYIKIAADTSRSTGGFWLTGSQHFQAMRDITETLAGRVAIINLLGFSCREGDRRHSRLDPFLPASDCIGERLSTAADSSFSSVFSRIWRGSYPALIAGPVHDRNLFYSSYLQTYLLRDVRDLTQIGNQDAFVRFLRACAARTGQLLNLSDLARDVDISVPTAKSWLSILEASFQVLLLRPYHSNLTKRLIKAPKLYFLDTGLAAYLTEWSSPETLGAGAMAGAMLETFVLSEILKSYWHRMRHPALYFYRDRDRKEVDLVLIHDGKLYAIEVKLAAKPRRRWVSQLGVLDRLGMPIGGQAVLCLCSEAIPLDRQTQAIPVGTI
jgi:predicted AAA+ superfamily ATPase